jgi:hypothetical protein
MSSHVSVTQQAKDSSILRSQREVLTDSDILMKWSRYAASPDFPDGPIDQSAEAKPTPHRTLTFHSFALVFAIQTVMT